MIALIGVKVAQLVLDVYAMRAAQVEEVFALHVQLARQNIDSDFVFGILQAAKLLCRQPPRPRNRAGCVTASSIPFILTGPVSLKRDSFMLHRNLQSNLHLLKLPQALGSASITEVLPA
jgi:hypothetical protein